MNEQLTDAIEAMRTQVWDSPLAQPSDDAVLRYEQCKAQLIGYHEQWQAVEWEPILVEYQYHLPVVNPETSRSSKIWTQAGRIDGLVQSADETYLLEHKTTSEDIESADSSYWQRLTIDSQVNKYMLAMWQESYDLAGTLYDVIRKPGIRPKTIPEAARRTIASLKTYCGVEVPDDIVQSVISGQTQECPRLYGLRLLADIHEQPGKYYQRRIVPRLDHDLLEFAGELWGVCDEINRVRRSGLNVRNSGACMTWGRPCEYLGICSGHDDISSQNWVSRKNVHAELGGIEDGRQVMTHSRLQCYHTCRRKHYYRYELGITKVVEEEVETLLYGHLLHVGLEQWWRHLMKGDDNGDNGDASREANRVLEGSPA